jgi:outer membrane protein assembly factor BamB
MNRNGRPGERTWVIAGLLVLALLSTAMTGCDRSTVPDADNGMASETVNSTFVDADGLLVAPTKIAASYSTEELNLGNGNGAGWPQFLDGAIYTFAYRENSVDRWMTAWDQAAGTKRWSVRTDQYYPLVSDEKHLFLSDSCLDKATGTTIWKKAPPDTSSFVLQFGSQITLHVDKESNTADRLYVLGVEEKKSGTEIKQRNPGVWIFDAATGVVLGRIDWPTLSVNYGRALLCDGTTLYASIAESINGEYPAQKSSLVAFDLATNKVLWQESVDGDGSNLVKQGNVLVFLRIAISHEFWIDAWQIGTTATAGTTRRLWTRQTDSTPIEETIDSFAVDSTHVYLQGSEGILRALDLASGKETWNHRFAPTKGYLTDGPEMGKPIDTYPGMKLTTTKDVLYVQDGGGLVAAFNPENGNELWNKRFSYIVWEKTTTSGWFVLQVVDKGFLVIVSDGRVDLWTASPADSTAAEQVVRDYFKYWNAKNLAEMEKRIAPDKRGLARHLEALAYVKLISIVERQPREAGTKMFVVVFDLKFGNVSYGATGINEGRNVWGFSLRRDDETSPWLIYGWGGGGYS